MLRRGDVAMRLAHRHAGRHEQHAVQVQLDERLLGGDQMPVVDRVERPAHDSEPELLSHDRICPSPSAMYFVVVSAASPMGPRAWSFCVEMPISAPSPNSVSY